MIDQAVAAVEKWQSDALKSPDLRFLSLTHTLSLTLTLTLTLSIDEAHNLIALSLAGGGMIDQAVAAVEKWQSDALKSPDLRLATPNQILPLPSPLISPLLSPLTQVRV